MQGFIRKMRTGVLVFLVVVIGGGFSSALPGNGSDSTTHDVNYEVLSFRSISLDDFADVEISYVRQGSKVTELGPTLLYATTWAGDKITASLDSDVADALFLNIIPGTPVAPGGSTPCDTPTGEGIASATLALSTAPVDLITSISDCGLDTTGEWIESDLTFQLDASGATADVDYTGPVTKTVTYTIDAGA